MCGLAGSTSKQSRSLCEKLLTEIKSRGPDETNYFRNQWIELGFNRLAIVDLLGGKQPFLCDKKKILTFCNGEIYNHLELREELKKEGVLFKSNHSDIECLAQGFSHCGISFLKRLDGMFAAVVVDLNKRLIYLIRDRNGERRIYYTLDSQGDITFCSEFKPLFKHLGSFRPNKKAWNWYMAFKAPPQDSSIDKRIHQVLPGEIVAWQNGAIKKEKWFNPNRHFADNKKSLYENTEEFDCLINKAVDLRCRADVDFGCYLSGGLDSSLITWLASKRRSNKLKTFSLTYKENIYNKSNDKKFSRIIAKKIQSEHQEIELNHKEFASEYPNIIQRYGQPICTTSATWFVSKQIGKTLKVALSGDGPDELLGSYFIHRLAYLIHAQKQGIEIKWANKIESSLAQKHEKSKVSDLLEINSVFNTREQAEYLGPELVGGASLANQLYESCRKNQGKNIFETVLNLEWDRFFNEGVLNYSDVLALSHSVENRLPYLSNEIVDFAKQLPTDQKYFLGTSKKILKNVATRYLPQELVHRKKEGFIEPNLYWISGKLQTWAAHHLEKAKQRDLGLIQWQKTSFLWDRFKKHHDLKDGKKIWMLLNIAIWEDQLMAGKP
jgi:asparagine synthase (glutamine-hydrolysing)